MVWIVCHLMQYLTKGLNLTRRYLSQVCACWQWWWCIWCGSWSWTLWSSMPNSRESLVAPPTTWASSTALHSSWLRSPSSSACWPACCSSSSAGALRGYSWKKETWFLNFPRLISDCFLQGYHWIKDGDCIRDKNHSWQNVFMSYLNVLFKDQEPSFLVFRLQLAPGFLEAVQACSKSKYVPK